LQKVASASHVMSHPAYKVKTTTEMLGNASDCRTLNSIRAAKIAKKSA